MSRRTLRMFLGALATAAVAIFGIPAHAGFVNTHFDPPVPTLIGDGTFLVDDACTSGVADNEYFASGFPSGCSVSLVNLVTSAPVVINFNGNLPFSDIASFVVIGEQFVGVNTGLIGPTLLGVDNYWLQFVSIFTPGESCDYEFECEWFTSSEPSVTNFVRLFENCSQDDVVVCGEGTLAGVADIVTFRAAPEPGSLGLILGALGAGWLARRRIAAG